jgi:amino acid transporter
VSFRRALGPIDATMVVIGGIIGSGIFINPYIVAERLESSALVLAAWAAGGLIALAGAFAYAELGSIFPKAGGQYVYLRDGWHPLVGFMYGWALLLLIESGAVAAVAITFAIFFGLTVATVLVFRRRYPLETRAPGSFAAPGYPVVQLAFAAVAAAVVLSVVWADRASAARGALLLAAGIPVFFWFRRFRRA